MTATLAVCACSTAPPYALPPVPLAEQYKEAAGHPEWTPATPDDALPRGPWWTAYRDDKLDALAAQLEQNSPELTAALARYEQAAAIAAQRRAPLFPSLSLNGQLQPNRGSDKRPPAGSDERYYDNDTLGLQAAYEVDLWGRVRNGVVAGNANLAAASATLESARLSLRAQLADQYIQLRDLDITIKLLADAVDAYRRALDLTTQRQQAGIGSGLDVARARTQLQTAKAQWQTSLGERAVLEHTIAALVGESPSNFSIAPSTAKLSLPTIPIGLPSTLLQRRPDIAAAERRTSAASAELGIVRAAWFPRLTLGGSIGYQSYEHSDWFQAPNLFWSIGPALALTLFDGGLRKARIEQAHAVLDEAGASYRGTVLRAFAEVENNLALLAHDREAANEQAQAVDAARKAVDYATIRYRHGAASYLEVTTAQTAALQARREQLTIDTRRLRASVALIRAFGGGWDAAEDPSVAGGSGAGPVAAQR